MRNFHAITRVLLLAAAAGLVGPAAVAAAPDLDTVDAWPTERHALAAAAAAVALELEQTEGLRLRWCLVMPERREEAADIAAAQRLSTELQLRGFDPVPPGAPAPRVSIQSQACDGGVVLTIAGPFEKSRRRYVSRRETWVPQASSQVLELGPFTSVAAWSDWSASPLAAHQQAKDRCAAALARWHASRKVSGLPEGAAFSQADGYRRLSRAAACEFSQTALVDGATLHRAARRFVIANERQQPAHAPRSQASAVGYIILPIAAVAIAAFVATWRQFHLLRPRRGCLA